MDHAREAVHSNSRASGAMAIFRCVCSMRTCAFACMCAFVSVHLLPSISWHVRHTLTSRTHALAHDIAHPTTGGGSTKPLFTVKRHQSTQAITIIIMSLRSARRSRAEARVPRGLRSITMIIIMGLRSITMIIIMVRSITMIIIMHRSARRSRAAAM